MLYPQLRCLGPAPDRSAGSRFRAQTTPKALETPPTGTPPNLSSVSQSRRRWRVGDKLASFARARRPPVGTAFQFTLNEVATVRFAFGRLPPGRNVDGKYVAPTARTGSSECR